MAKATQIETEREIDRQALERAAAKGLTICSHTDPTAEGREGLTVAEAAEIASQDAGLIYVAGCPGEFAATVTGTGDRTYAGAANLRSDVTYRCELEPGHRGPCKDYRTGHQGYWT